MNSDCRHDSPPMRHNGGRPVAARRRFARLCAAAALAPLILLAKPAAAAAGDDISPAEKLLFQTNHLANVKGPSTLHYTYERQGSAEPAFTDAVTVDVGKKGADGNAPVSAHFLSGERAVEIPTVQEVEGNPALLGFLERDIREMKRLTGGSVNYFRKRIRLALADAAEVKPVSVSYDGREVKGREVTIRPYADDPMREKFPKYLQKRYEFVFSDAVPGTLYQARTVVPQGGSGASGKDGQGKDRQGNGGKAEAGKSGGAPLIEETMTIASKEK